MNKNDGGRDDRLHAHDPETDCDRETDFDPVKDFDYRSQPPQYHRVRGRRALVHLVICGGGVVVGFRNWSSMRSGYDVYLLLVSHLNKTFWGE